MKKYLILIAVVVALTGCSKTKTVPMNPFLGNWYADSVQVKEYNGNTLFSSGTNIFNHSDNALIYNFITNSTGILTEPGSETPIAHKISSDFTYTTNNGFIYNKYDTGEIDTLQILVNTGANFIFQVKKHAPGLILATHYCTK